MRILQLCTNYLMGGIQRHVIELGDFLVEQGHEVVLAGDHGEWEPKGDAPRYEHVALNPISSMGGSLINRVSHLLPAARRLRQVLETHRIELIHAHETAPAIIAKLATRGLSIPIIFTYHGSERERIASVASTARRTADLTISPSRTSLEHLIEHGLPRERSRVVGLGTHPLPAPDMARAAELRRDLLGEKGRYLICSLSRMDHQKGIDMMIEVARKLRDVRDDIVLAIAGHGPLESHVRGWAEVANVAEHVRFLGYTDDVVTLLAASDLYLLTSRWEALPISIVEAFQMRLPVIATDCGGVGELVDDSVGRLLPVGDVAGISNAVLELIEDDDKRLRLGEAARERSLEERFSPYDVKLEMETLYREMLAR